MGSKALRRAASIVLVRESASPSRFPFEVLLLKRSSQLSFASSMFVFPGGTVDADDQRVAATLGEHATELQVAAFRELVEETGICLTTPSPPADALDKLRAALNAPAGAGGEGGGAGGGAAGAGQQPLLTQFFGACGVVPLLETFRPWCRFVTPAHEKKRFDTTFFVCSPRQGVAGGRALEVDGGEITHAQWVTPPHALALCAEGGMHMLPPQWLILAQLQQAGSLGALDLLAAERANRTALGGSLFPVQPHVVEIQRDKAGKGHVVLALPGDEDHTPPTHAFPGRKGDRHRVVCTLPLGSGFELRRSVSASL